MKETSFTSIEEMQVKKAAWVKETKELRNFDGIKNTLTKLYTSSGHFIFELLQNAEDVGATTVKFKLYEDKLVFEHNGTRPFDIADIDSITNIGDSTKFGDGNSIGKFGIGFKSVFEYTASPEIHSGKYHFKIEDMFIPKVIDSLPDYDSSMTVIILLFNGDKNRAKCYEEIRTSLKDLSPLSLLFLKNIKIITSCFNGSEIKLSMDSFTEVACPSNLCRLRKTDNGVLVNSDGGFYKRFFKTVTVVADENGNKKDINIAIAFKVKKTESTGLWHVEPLFKQGTTIPNGQVFAYFPCKAEERKLCFHIHAPFALTVDREKLREDDANMRIIDEIANLCCESMQELKSDKLVDLELYKTLPNPKNDNDLGKYNNILSKITNCFTNNHPYILMADGKYQYPKGKYLGFKNIRDLLSDEDLSILNDSEGQSFFVKNPSQNDQRDYNFLISLGVKEYRIADFLVQLKESSRNAYNNLITRIGMRDIHWFIKLYSLMNSQWNSIEDNWRQKNLGSLELCYCEDEKLHSFNECYLTGVLNEQLNLKNYGINIVHSECSGRFSRYTEVNLRSLFESKMGIREYTIPDLVKALCDKNFANKKPSLNDVKTLYLFFSSVVSDENVRTVLGRYKIFCSDEGVWDTPESFYTPEEYDGNIKNISIYYDFLNKKSRNRKQKLSPEYLTLFEEKDIDSFNKLVRLLRVCSSLPILRSTCARNSKWENIENCFPKTAGGNRNSTDIDWVVPFFKEFLLLPKNDDFFYLIWSFLAYTSINYAYCEYSPAQKYPSRKFPSQLCIILANSQWVLQNADGKTDFVKPAKATLKRIPSQYMDIYENSSYLKPWLSAIGFGKVERLENEKQKEADEFCKSMGVEPEWVCIMKELRDRGMSKETISSALFELQSKSNSYSMQEEDDFDEELLSEKTLEKYKNSSVIEYAKKLRSVREGNYKIKEKATAYLTGKYMSSDGDMSCQICNHPMPFKNTDGKAYFETVQLFNSKLVRKEIEYNYLALCPVCSARMKVYFDKEKQQDLFKRMKYSLDSVDAFKIQLDKEEAISFSKMHITQLRAIAKGESDNHEEDIDS